MKIDESGAQNFARAARRPYATPAVVVYGTVRDLTQSGSVLGTENTKGQDEAKKKGG